MDKIIFVKGNLEAPQVLDRDEFMQIIDELRGQIKNPFEIQKNAEDELNSDAST